MQFRLKVAMPDYGDTCECYEKSVIKGREDMSDECSAP